MSQTQTATESEPEPQTEQQTLTGEPATARTAVPSGEGAQLLYYAAPDTDLGRLGAWYRRLKAEGVIR